MFPRHLYSSKDAEFCCFWLSVTTQHIKHNTTATQQQQQQEQKPTVTPAIPDRPAFTSQHTYPHLSLLRTAVAAVILAAVLFRPSNSAVKERVKKGELFFVHMILFYWPATLATAVAPRRKEEVGSGAGDATA